MWAPGPVWTSAENLAPPTGIRSTDRPARSQSLYRLNYPAHTNFIRCRTKTFCSAKRFRGQMKLGNSDVEKLRIRLRRRKPHYLEMNWTECNMPYVEELILERVLCEYFMNHYPTLCHRSAFTVSPEQIRKQSLQLRICLYAA